MEKKKLVILGGGFGGINTYKSLSAWVKKNCEITIVDRNNHFLFTPLLPEVAGGNLDNHNVVEPIRDIISRDIRFIHAHVKSVDTNKKKIYLEDQELSYDLLVSTLGAHTFFYGIKGAERHCYPLNDLNDAMILKNRFIDVMEKASRTTDMVLRKKLLTIVIVGGGPTGVELAGEIGNLYFGTFVKQFGMIKKKDINIIIVDALENILPMFSQKLQGYAEKSINKARIKLLKNVTVAEVDEEGIISSDGKRIYAKTVIWTAGVSANPLPCECGKLELERGRIKTNEHLQALGIPEVFVIGDMALFPTPEGRGLPMSAQVAKQQGVHTASNIERFLKNKELVPFVYREKGLMASIGRFNAVAEIFGFRFYGMLAWYMWRTVYLFNFASWNKRFHILADWSINLFTRRDTTRL